MSNLKGIVQNFGHRTLFPNEKVCYLSFETVFNTFHLVVLVAEITSASVAGLRMTNIFVTFHFICCCYVSFISPKSCIVHGSL